MNFLAHLALAAPTPSSLVGNLMADFAKGTRATLLEQFPQPIVDAMFMHRSIDRFTDTHPCFKKAKSLMLPEHRKFAGVVIDIFFDHFLSLHWQRFYRVNLDTFIDDCYRTLDQHPQWHSELFSKIYPSMRRENWLACYRSKDGILLTLQRVSQRSKYTRMIADCSTDFEENYTEFENIFLEFYPQLMDFSSNLIKSKPSR